MASGLIDAFFVPEPILLEQGHGFALFGLEHRVVLGICLVCAGLLARRYTRLPRGLAWGRPRRRMLLVLAVVPLALLASRDVALVALGLLSPIFWPLHICNFCEYLALAFALTCDCPSAYLVGELFFAWSATGALSALLFPGWSYCPLWTYASLGGFAEHTLLLVMVWAPVLGGDFVPSARHLWIPLVAAIVGGALFRPFNAAFDTNFFFVAHPLVDTPFEWLSNVWGDPGYLVPYLLLSWLLWVGWYMLAAHISRRGTGRLARMGSRTRGGTIRP